MVGKSTWASAPTGSSEKQPSPTSSTPAMISEVAMGFLMNGAEMLTGSGSRRRMVRGAGGGADLHMGAGLQPVLTGGHHLVAGVQTLGHHRGAVGDAVDIDHARIDRAVGLDDVGVKPVLRPLHRPGWHG